MQIQQVYNFITTGTCPMAIVGTQQLHLQENIIFHQTFSQDRN